MRASKRNLQLLVLALAALVAGPAAPALADTIPSGFALSIQITQGASTWTGTETGLSSVLSVSTSGDETTLALTDPQTVLGGGATIQDWDSTFDPDPFVTNNFVVVNNSGVTQTYSVSVNAPVGPALLASTIIQSNLILSINDDDNDDGATVSSVAGTPVYDAVVNGLSELTFLDDPFSNTCASPFDCTFNGSPAAAVASQGFGPVLATSIGITIEFELSPGDSAAVQSRFEIVPEPTAAVLAPLGLATATACGRLRRA